MNLQSAIFMFLYMYPTFIVELLAAEIVLLHKCPKRQGFWILLPSGLCVLFGTVMLLCCLQALLGGSAIVGAIGYIVVFLFTLVVLWVCYNVPFKILLFFGSGAYALQNLCYRLVSLCEVSGLLALMMRASMSYTLAEGVLHVSSFVLAMIFFCRFFVRRVNEKGMANLYNGSVLILSLVTLVVTIVLCSITNTYGWMSVQLSVANFCFAIISDIFILWVQSGMLERIALRSDIETVRMLWEQDRRQYEIAKENIDLINIKCHDMKHRIREMRPGGGGFSAEEVAEIENCISVYDAKVDTGCEPIDVVLTEKSLLCNKQGIRLSCMADGSSLGFMRDYDLYSLFGNMLSNAVEAVQDIPDENKRVIDLTVQEMGGMAVIRCVNYYEGELKTNGGEIATRKADAASHGFGIKSMRMLAKKYGGILSYTFEDGIFDLKIMIPTQTKRMTA